MRARALVFAALVVVSGCGGAASNDAASGDAERETAAERETVFDPLTSTIDRAEGVQQTVDEQAAEQRRRIEEAER
jgi:ABC-type glycerol-3-phosphate transport system substrate-binding protein